ncbi:MAG: nucleotide disphospho-sugar-binding domain-containing protein [Bacteroidota bacterium]
MAKIVCITSGLTGIVNASFELVNRLQAGGHEVLCAAPRDIASRFEQQGISFKELPEITQHPGPVLPQFSGPLRKGKRLWYKIRQASKRRKAALAALQPSGFSQWIQEQAPDLLLLDIELHEYIIRAHALNLPFVLLSQWFSLWCRPGLPYLLTDTIPGQGWRGKVWGIKAHWQWVRLKRWWTFTKQRWYTVGTDRRTVLLDFARAEGFPMKYIRENYWPGPFSYDQLPVLAMVAKEMEFPHDIRPNMHYVGPMVDAQRMERAMEGEEATLLDRALRLRQERGAALLYGSVSTLHAGDQRFVDHLIEAVGTQKDWVLVMGLGGKIGAEQYGKLPDNVFVFSYIPQIQLLAKADCSINHGGIHTINECLHFKVPMLVYSGKRSDQNGCAARVAYHQLGLMADKDQDGPEEIRAKIQEVLQSKRFKVRLEEMHQHYFSYIDQKSLLQNVERLLYLRPKHTMI